MESQGFPQPPSHKTFTFGSVTIDSNFDSGNCSHVEKNSQTNYNIWIGTDHPKNNYRTWFYFSIEGLNKGTLVTFNIKNMQNQSKLLYEGLVPVYREESSDDWKRIKEKVSTGQIEFCEGWIEWSFRHTMTSNEKVYLAFFYPWSNDDNNRFLSKIEKECKKNQNIYFYRAPIIRSLEGRPIQFLAISSNKLKTQKEEKIQDQQLFKNHKKPNNFSQEKKGIVIGARVHPGEVPGSHVMTGIIDYLVSNTEQAKILRDTFVFYIFPIFNPDGVSRGHYRVDTNGINLNRCYLSPSAKYHPPIYAVKRFIMHLHNQQRFFAFLDLHAHASRRGTFIYGNSTNELVKQVQACIFPKILSMNSIDFEYEGSNFTQKNMYCKDKADHVSKQGAGRVAIFKATKNAFCWTLECNYNISRVNNILEAKKNKEDEILKTTEENLEEKVIVDYKYPSQKDAKEFFSIETFHKLGKQVCQSFLDLVKKNPFSRVENPHNHFKTVQNLKMQLAVALMRMAPNRFETNFRRIYNGLISAENKDLVNKSMKALYFLLIKNAKIQNIGEFLKNGDPKQIVMPTQQPKKPSKTIRPVFRSQAEKPATMRITKKMSILEMTDKIFQNNNGQTISPQKNEEGLYPVNIDSDGDSVQMQDEQIVSLLFSKMKNFQKKVQSRTNIKLQQFKMMGFSAGRQSIFVGGERNPSSRKEKRIMFKNKFNGKVQGFPALSAKKQERAVIKGFDSKILKKGIKEKVIEFI